MIIQEEQKPLSNPPAEYPAACCGDESGLFPLPGEGKLKIGRGQKISKPIKIVR